MKTCTRCGRPKPAKDYSRKGAGRATMRKVCAAEYHRRWYAENREREIRRQTIITRRKRKEARRIIGELKTMPCADCGRSYPPYVMDFDHRKAKHKRFSIAEAVRLGLAMSKAGVARLRAEIAKCDVVCSNCHRIRTHNRVLARHSPDTLTRRL